MTTDIERIGTDGTTVRDVTYELLRAHGLTTIFGNVGSTEETFLAGFPSGFRYVLGLQEASVIAMADGYAQATRRPALVNLHTGAGLGNAMGNLLTAFQNKTPLIVTAGQQTREMLLLEPWLTNVDATMLPRPWVKWAYEPVRAQDVPAAFMRAIATAVQPPAGPVFLSLPLDDWDQPCAGPAVVRTAATRVAPDPGRLRKFAEVIRHASDPVLIYGAAIARSNGWKQAAALAEALNAPVWAAPASERAPFPEDHPLYVGGLPFAMGPLSDKLAGTMSPWWWAPRCSGTTRTWLARTCRPACGCCTSPTTRPKPAARRSATAWSATPCCPWPGSPACSPVTPRPPPSRTSGCRTGWRHTRRRRTEPRMACCPPHRSSRR